MTAPTAPARPTATRRRRRVAVTAVCAALAATLAACSSSTDAFSGDPRDMTGNNFAGRRLAGPTGPDVPTFGKDLDQKLTIGVVISSSGTGKDFQQMANGSRVVPTLVGSDDVEVKVEDDRGTPEGAAAAVSKLKSQGAAAIVYASVGPSVDPGLKAAAAAGLPAILPYDGTPALVQDNPNTFSLALPTPEMADKLVDFAVDERKYSRTAILWDRDTAYGQASAQAVRDALAKKGRTPIFDAGFGVTDPTLRPLALQTGTTAPDSIFVMGDSTSAYRLINELHVTGTGAQMFLPSVAATPTLGSQDINALAPPVRIGTLSTGLAGGPWNPTPAVRAFYDRRTEASGKTAADFGVADIVSADATLAIVAAAEKGGTSSADIRRTLDGMSFDGVGGSYSFANRVGVDEDDYAVTAYNREPSASQTYVGKQFPDVRTQGGFFVAVPGSAPSLENLDRFEG